MVKDLPLFPLNLVVFPDEEVNLHIFEPRYKQLINDCLETKTTFGIPSYVLTKIEFGTEVKITEVTKTYSDGRMDVKTRGLRPIKVMEFQNPWNNRLYAGGPVELMEETQDKNEALELKIRELCIELFDWLDMEQNILPEIGDVMAAVVHKIGLKPEEEYKLLKMKSQLARQEYIINHLENLIPALERAEKAKDRIRMNGHFKHFDPLKF